MFTAEKKECSTMKNMFTDVIINQYENQESAIYALKEAHAVLIKNISILFYKRLTKNIKYEYI